MQIDLVGQSGRDSDNASANPSRLVNVYAEKTTDGERILKSVLGMTPHTQLEGVFVRAMDRVDGVTYAVCGGHLWRVTADGTADDLGEVDTGPASIAGNNGLVTVQAGTRYFVFDPEGSTLTEPATGAFSSFGSVEYFDNYTILTEAGARRFQWSDLAEPATLPGLSFSTADGKDDNLVRAFAMDGRLYLFKNQSTEIWFNTGQSGANALQRVGGGVKETGLLSHSMICRFAGGAFMVSSDGRAYLIAGGQFQPVTTPPVETAIKLHQPMACVAYADEGHTFLCIIFKFAPAWCYDLATGEWHERAEGAHLGPWNIAAASQMGNDWIVGRNNGQISMLRRANADGVTPLVREITSRTMRMDGARTVIREFEVTAKRGYSEGTMTLQLSRDGGSTWGTPKPKGIGDPGRFDRRIIWRNLGQARTLTARLRWTDPADFCVSTMARIAT